jgi:glycosyltransferase involved in cell wall biosynthesis
MRVLHISSGNLYGGIETILVTLARQRKKCPQMESRFALCFTGRLYDELEAEGAEVTLLGKVRVRNPYLIHKARLSLKQLLQAEGYDLVVCHSSWPHAIFGPVVKRLGKPLVFWLHSPANGRHWTEIWAGLSEPDLILCVSEHTARSARLLFPHSKHTVYRSPLPVSPVNLQGHERNTIRAALNTPTDAVVITQVSRMEALKGHIAHLKALARLRNINNWVCWQVGGAQSASEEQYLTQVRLAAHSLGIESRVRFLGQRSDVPRLLAASDIYCQPNNKTEGFSLVFLEACSAGLPVVTTDLGSASELIDESCGVLIPSGDIPTLAASLKLLIQDTSLRKRLGIAASRRAEDLCNTEVQMRKLHSILCDVAVKRSRARSGID